MMKLVKSVSQKSFQRHFKIFQTNHTAIALRRFVEKLFAHPQNSRLSNNTGFNCMGPLIRGFLFLFFFSKYCKDIFSYDFFNNILFSSLIYCKNIAFNTNNIQNIC